MGPPNRFADAALGLALCLPVACLTRVAPALGSPLGPLDDAIRPEVVGTALVALASLVPLAVMLARRSARVPSFVLLYAGAWLCARLAAHGATDTFELARAELFALATLALFVSATGLDALGRRVLAHGSVLVSLVLTGDALVGAAVGHPAGLAGALGNTGSLSEAALPGALVGAASFTQRRGGWGWAGLVATLAYGLFVGAAPVLAGALSFAGAALVGLLALRAHRKRLGLAAAAFALGFGGAFTVPSTELADADEPAGVMPTPAQAPPAVTGGVEVRQLLWSSVGDLIADHALAGVGAGQFAAAFPRYRDPDEIERSSHDRRLWQETEVEHAHADVLHVAAEGGLVGGALFVAFLLAVLVRVRGALGGDAPADEWERRAFGLAALALVVNGLARTPLTWNPASAALGFALLGASSSRDEAGAPSRAWTRGLAWVVLALLALSAPRVLALVRHDRALSASFAALATLGDGPATPADVGAAREAVARALELRPDSPLARSHAARLDARAGAAPEDVRAHWRALLEHRPVSLEALIQDGLFALRSGRPDEARARWERVVELDPGHPIARRNLVRLAAEQRDVEAIDTHVAALAARGRWTEPFVLEVAAEAALRGLATSVDALLAHVVDARAPEVLDALAEREDEASRTRTALGLRAAAHRRWAGEHARAASWSRAVRSAREARSAAAAALGAPSPPFELEYAAALSLAGQAGDAREVLERLGPVDAADVVAPWARAALSALGVPETAPR